MANGPNVSGMSQDIGSSAHPVTAIGAHNFGRSYYRHVGASGDVRALYADLDFTSTGSGEFLRLRAIANGTDVATAGTVNAAHLTGRVAAAKTVSGALNALRCTLEVAGTTPTPGGTLSALQLDSNIVTGWTQGSADSFCRVTDSGAGSLTNLFNFADCASGTGNLHYGSTLKCVGPSGAKYIVLSDAENAFTTSGNIALTDDVFLKFGTSNDVTMEWDTASTPDQLIMLPAADDSVFAIGNGTLSFDVKTFGATANDFLLWDASESNLEVTGDARIDFSGATCLAANTDGLLIKAGTSAAKVTEDTADIKFIGIYTDCGAATGDSRTIYARHYITSTGSGEAGRFYTTLTAANAATGGTVNGAHISLSLDASASVSGQGNAARFTLDAAADTRTLNGNLACVMLESNIATGNTVPASLAFMRIVNLGAVSVGHLLRTAAPVNSTIFATHTTQAMSHSIRMVDDAGTPYYIMCTNAATNRGGAS